jgi:hypothetical protein
MPQLILSDSDFHFISGGDIMFLCQFIVKQRVAQSFSWALTIRTLGCCLSVNLHHLISGGGLTFSLFL